MRRNRKTAAKLSHIYTGLEKRYGKIECPLTHSSPYELLVAVVLSAQCTDKKVNEVTPRLFAEYPDVYSLAEADGSKLEDIIRSIGLYRAKSANLIEAARKIAADFNGIVPREMDSLLTLRGVGRKTANVILGNAFGIPGFPVDTHVIRLTNRLGIVNTENPEKIEAVVTANLAEKYWTDFSHLLITHGRQCCRARKPECPSCDLDCPSRS